MNDQGDEDLPVDEEHVEEPHVEEPHLDEQGPITAFDPPLPGPADPRRRTRVALAALAVVALVGGGAAVALWPDAEPAAEPTTTTTTEAPPTTTEPVDELPPGVVEIATARPEVAELEVLAEPPADWAGTAPEFTAVDVPAPPETEASVPAREPLPTVEEPIVGRRATETGWAFDNPGPYDPPQPFTMVVRERRGDWAKVKIPLRPNSTVGYVRVADVTLSTVDDRIEIRLGERMLRAYSGTELIAETQVVVGSPFTPTPTGSFYVTDIVPQTSPTFGPVALPTDAYSEVMDEFDTGVPVVAMHGTNRPELIGQARSNGCIRIPNEVIVRMAELLPRGTPVYIYP